ncbi:hypothetical protein [Nocardia noduli]|uniref:hypothetical protein n=1 Tax=Nocardia noduli TaxID=2815722 RepID=UPI001C244E69|nr:hypothetical protein [Nocardia noduli]
MIAADAADAARCAGGWVFDRTAAGWEVVALVADYTDIRPLQVVGAKVLDLEQTLARPPHHAEPAAVVVSAEIYRGNDRVRARILQCLELGTEVSLWGKDLPPELEDRMHSARHRVSVAARAFKAHALTRSGYPVPAIGHVEEFRTGTAATRLKNGVGLAPDI